MKFSPISPKSHSFDPSKWSFSHGNLYQLCWWILKIENSETLNIYVHWFYWPHPSPWVESIVRVSVEKTCFANTWVPKGQKLNEVVIFHTSFLFEWPEQMYFIYTVCRNDTALALRQKLCLKKDLCRIYCSCSFNVSGALLDNHCTVCYDTGTTLTWYSVLLSEY